MRFAAWDKTRERLRRVVRSVRYRGDNYCALCGGRFDQYGPFGQDFEVVVRRRVVGAGQRSSDVCPVCGGLSRTRLLMLYFEKFVAPERRITRILHFAPEYPIYSWFKVAGGEIDYTACDIDPDHYSKIGRVKRVDIIDLPFEDQTFDLVICSHVLEHVPDDAKAMSELYRVTHPGGAVLALAPFALDGLGTDEDPSVVDPAERERRYCQFDHVRLYDREDFVARLAMSGFNVRLFDPHSEFPEEAKKMSLDPRELLPVAVRPAS